MDKQEIIPIDMDLVRELRFQGDKYNANKLVHAFRKQCEKNKIIERNELKRISRKVRPFHGLCSHGDCPRPHEEGGKYCRKCLESNVKSSKRLKDKYRLKGLCSNCGHVREMECFLLCERCRLYRTKKEKQK